MTNVEILMTGTTVGLVICNALNHRNFRRLLATCRLWQKMHNEALDGWGATLDTSARAQALAARAIAERNYWRDKYAHAVGLDEDDLDDGVSEENR